MAADIGPALLAVRQEASCVRDQPDEVVEAMLKEIGAFVKLVGGGWPPEHRQEFIDQAAVDFADIPVSLLGPALTEARRRVRWAREFVPWVHEAVEKSWTKLKVEQDRLQKLAQIAATA